MTPVTALPERADGTACQEFQETLVQGSARPLEEFLPAEEHADYLGTLCRLVVLELEDRWQRFQQQASHSAEQQTVDYPAGVAAQLERFPRLKDAPDAVRWLIVQEYLVRHRLGDRPDERDFRAQYAAYLQGVTLPAVSAGPTDDRPAPDVPERLLPGYRILGELGRGGMGVVFRAEQLSLKRVVALKMVIGDRLAGTSARHRFRTEAEAVAHLHHPNIVQIYEVGDHDGCPYFAMEYVEGGSLSRALGGRPVAPMQAARLVEALARAMQHAHARGVVHRDLKPANVLLQADSGAVTEPLATAIPKITDFGLAKRLDGDSGQTQTGAVLGTPSYMAPEQAAGRSETAGPLTDIYALGAILYEALTGRPPFRGATTVETMQQVLHQDVTPPSRLQPRISRDLETICLKALAREPVRRYVSAQEMADDLARFQSGEPILARREPLAARVWRKARRQAALVAVAAVIGIAVAVVAVVVSRNTHQQRVADVVRALEQDLQERDWPDDRLTDLDQRLAALAALDAEQAAALRPIVTSRYAEVLRESFSTQRRATLAAADLPAFERKIAALAERDAALGAAVLTDFQGRLRKLQSVVVEAPFADLTATFNTGHVAICGNALAVQPGVEPLLTKTPSLGKVEIEATFDAGWAKARALSLVINHHAKKEYMFVLTAPDRVDADGRQQPPRATDQIGVQGAERGEVSLFILRNGERLREVRIEAGRVIHAPTLVLFASREGDRLVFQVNDLPPVVYYDSLPLAAANAGVFGLQVPHGIGLRRLRLTSQVLPPQPSPLERGDELSARGQFQDALQEYRRHEAAAGQGSDELRYKIGHCLYRLQRHEEAIKALDPIAAGTSERWAPLAGMHLWVIYLLQDRLDQVDTLLLDLTRRYSVDQIASVLPLEVRTHLLTGYTVQSLGAKFIRPDPQRAAKLERVVQLVDLLRAGHHDRLHLRISLVRAYHFAGQYDKAIALTEAMLKDRSLVGSWPDRSHPLIHWQLRAVEEYGWLMRLVGDPKKALAAVDQRLWVSTGELRGAYAPLLVERARLLAFQGDRAGAEADLQRYLKDLGTDPYSVRYWSEACLLLGFLKHAAGDIAGAKKLWEQGTHRSWLARWRAARPGVDPLEHLRVGGSLTITNMLLTSLAGTMSQQEADELVNLALFIALDEQSAEAFKDLLRITPQQFQELWQSPRGQEAARSMALRTITWNRYQFLPTSVMGVGMLRHGALPAQVSPEQDALAWKLVEDLQDGYFSAATISKAQIFGMAATWKGLTGVLGWDRIQASLPPHIRGPLAYCFGQRFQHHRKDAKEARRFFQAALDDARRTPANAALERLAEAELKRLAAP